MNIMRRTSNLKLTTNEGFTLIELLVVIAIIGILAAIILANLAESRKKGDDAAVKVNLSNIQVQAEVYKDQHGDAYGTNKNLVQDCSNKNTLFSDSLITSAIAQITLRSGKAPGCTVAPYGASWAIDATLKSGGLWCVDSKGWGSVGSVFYDGDWHCVDTATVCSDGSC